MTTAKDLYAAGDLAGALDELSREVKANPMDERRRTFLFELLCFAGAWDRAERQLDALAAIDVKTGLGVELYRGVIKAERERERVFATGQAPNFLTSPPAYVEKLLDGMHLLAKGETEAAGRLVEEAEEERPLLPGQADGEPFDDFRDSDDTVAPVLELFVQDRYTWVPWEQIRRLDVPHPARLRDLLWTPVKLEGTDGSVGELLAPALYQGSAAYADDAVRLGRVTEWRDSGGGIQRAAGLRMLMVGAEERSLLDLRAIELAER